MRNKVLSQICGSKFCVPKICCSIWIFSPISDTSSKRNPGAFPFETPSWEDGKKKNIIKNSLKNTSPKHKLWISLPQRDIWHHNIKPPCSPCRCLQCRRCFASLLEAVLSRFDLKRPRWYRREEPNLYIKGKVGEGPNGSFNIYIQYHIYIYIYTLGVQSCQNGKYKTNESGL